MQTFLNYHFLINNSKHTTAFCSHIISKHKLFCTHQKRHCNSHQLLMIEHNQCYHLLIPTKKLQDKLEPEVAVPHSRPSFPIQIYKDKNCGLAIENYLLQFLVALYLVITMQTPILVLSPVKNVNAEAIRHHVIILCSIGEFTLCYP